MTSSSTATAASGSPTTGSSTSAVTTEPGSVTPRRTARAVRLGVTDPGSVVTALVLDPVVGEPEAAVAVEDEVIRRDQAGSARRVVEQLDVTGLEVDALDPAAFMRRRRLMGDRDAAHVEEVVRAAVVADVELAVG